MLRERKAADDGACRTEGNPLRAEGTHTLFSWRVTGETDSLKSQGKTGRP